MYHPDSEHGVKHVAAPAIFVIHATHYSLLFLLFPSFVIQRTKIGCVRIFLCYENKNYETIN